MKQRIDKLSNYISWNIPIPETNILMSYSGVLHKVYRAYGIDISAMSIHEKQSISDQVNNAFSRIDNGWSVWVEDVKTSFSYEVASDFKSDVHRILEQDIIADMTGKHYKNSLYITFVYDPGITDSSDLLTKSDQNIKEFETGINNIIGSLSSIIVFTELSKDETASYLYKCISGNHKNIRWDDQTHDFSDGLIDQEVSKNPAMLGDKYILVVGIKKFPPASMPEMIKELNNIFCNYRQVIRLIFKDRSKAIDDLEARERQWVESDQKILPGIWNFFNRRNESSPAHINDAIKEKAGNCYGLKQLLIMAKTNVCDYTHNFILTGTDKKQLSRDVEAIISILNASGFVSFLETKNTLAAWLGSLPGNMNNPRKHPMSITHLSDLLPISTKYQGKHENSRGLPALCLVKTEDTEPFWFNLDGHTMMVGPTGSGKSYALSAIMAFFYRYPNAQIFAFDKGGSLKTTSMAFGGKHIELSEHIFQPLRDIDTKQDFDWAVDWISLLMKNHLDDQAGNIRSCIMDSLRSLKRRPKEERTLSGFMNFTNTEMREVLSHYKDSVIDGDTENIMEHDWFCFEMGSMFENNSEIAVPVLLYLFYMIEKRLQKGTPTLIILDEVWLYLENTIFAQRIRLWLKTLRKLWGHVVFATQEIDDLQDSSIYTSLENSTNTEIWLPNKKAKKDEITKFYKKAGLTNAEIEQISIKAPKQNYLIKQPEGSRWIQFGGGAVTKAIFGCEQTDLPINKGMN